MKYICSILLTIASVKSFSQSFSGDTWATARNTGKANIVITYAEVPNYSEIVNENPSGICFEIMEHFVEYVESTYRIDLNVQYKSVEDPKNFQAFLASVKSSTGGVFGLGDVSITEDRKKQFEFSPPYLSNIAILVTSKSVADLTALGEISSEFSGMTAVVQEGSSHDKRVTRLKNLYGGFEIEYVNNSDMKLQKVISSSRYFTYIDFPNYVEAVLNGLSVKRHSAGDDSGGKFGLIMPKGSDWSSVMNEFFRSGGGYTSSDKYRKSLEENLGEKILRLTDALAARDE